jgi:hypothetical protein
MVAQLCQGAPAEHRDNACATVPGGDAYYFGADQPRITAEALLPWAALGSDGPPADGRIKVEVSASAWFHSRWMSLTGMAPAKGSASPRRWIEMRLGGTSPSL